MRFCYKLVTKLVIKWVFAPVVFSLLASSLPFVWAALPPLLQLAPPGVRVSQPVPSQNGLNLWRIEATGFARSHPLISPNLSTMVYSEAFYRPDLRQITGGLYQVSLGPLSGLTQPGCSPSQWLAPFNPKTSLQSRKTLYQVGLQRARPFAFDALSVVDWSATGRRLLVQRRSGVNYLGLHTSELLVYDLLPAQRNKALNLYPQIIEAVKSYWQARVPAEAPVFSAAWELEPVGWQVASDTNFWVKAWAYHTQQSPTYLGLWQINTATARAVFISDASNYSPSVAQNGIRIEATPVPDPATPLPSLNPLQQASQAIEAFIKQPRHWRFWQPQPPVK